MTKQSAEKITGSEVTVSQEGHWWIVSAVTQAGEFRGTATSLKLALQQLVEKNWAAISRMVFERDGWRCKKCQSISGLQCHHLHFRSHGRVDRLENLESRCPACHEEEHS